MAAGSRLAFALIDRVQTEPPEHQLMGLALALAALASSSGVEPVRVLRLAGNLYVRGLATGEERLTALQAHAISEMKY